MTTSRTIARRPPEGPGAPSASPRDLAVLLALALVAVLVCAAVLGWTGGAATLLLGDPGPLVRWGLPAAKVLADVAAALTIGVLALAAIGLPKDRPAALLRALRTASAAAGVWAATTLAVAVLGYADLSGQPLDDPSFGSQLLAYLTDTDPGRGVLLTALVALVVNLVALLSSGLRAAGLLTLLSLVGLVPLALAGHSASAESSHETAVTSLGLHVAGASLWVGGLAGLVLLRGVLGTHLAVVARRYSTLALWAFVAVALSGVVNGWVRVGGLDALGSRYGIVLLAKTGALVVLGLAGWLHRTRTLADLDDGDDGAFVRLAVVEGVVMALATGLAVALARSPSPVPDVAPVPLSPTQVATGYPLPPEPTPLRWFTTWQPDLLWVVVVAVLAGTYALGVARLRGRGDAWPVLRTVCWFLGLAVLLWVTCSGPAAYGRVMFSAHMVGHMVQSMVVPIFLVLGAPMTLLLRAVHPRADGSRGPREWVLAVLESAYLRGLTHPVVVSFLFAGSLVLFYYSPLFEVALTTHVGHELMHVHFLFAGYLMAWMMIGIDPGPHRPAPPMLLLMLFVTMAFHAFFGVALISSTTVLAEDYWTSVERPWGGTLLEDQKLGGGLAWGFGEVPTLALAVILAVQWARSDDREARRRDRRAERDGDAELVAYNAMLAKIAQDDERAAGRDRDGHV